MATVALAPPGISAEELTAEFLPTERNRMMYVTYKFAGFREVDKRYGLVRLENDLESVPAFPDYICVSASKIFSSEKR